jgi:hypothetical protein
VYGIITLSTMAKFKEKNEATFLRKKGYSISDISKKLEVSKSTVSVWCRDIILQERAILDIAKRSERKSTAGLLRYSEFVRSRRQQEATASQLKGKKYLGKLSQRDIYCIGLGIYWGEGYKKGSQEFGFTNSDPSMVKFYIHWLEAVFDIKKEDLILRVSINEFHKNRIREVEKFWSKLTQVPIDQFTKISLIKTTSKKVYPDSVHMGTLRIKVRKGTNLRREVLGSLSGIVEQI